jgi:hypothetical protein
MKATDITGKTKVFLLLTGLFLFASCYQTYDNERIREPEGLIPKEEMVLILADIEVAESALREKQNLGHEIEGTDEVFYTYVFSKHGVSKEQFDQSLNYYKSDLKALEEIYEAVVNRLSLIESEVSLE